MAAFKVVLDGIDLSEGQSQQISESIRDAVLQGLADHDAGSREKLSASKPLGLSMVPIFKGELMGWMLREQEIDDQFREILGKEFGG
jgi:hypothetical protein